ncbi:MAG: NAD-dependent epimerase/dehydratase family protein [Bdellovibrionaceae bacterium]|nr:NAD-dependent epimerase/dehydratase family protein [Pseudobdellovibrionaceae bacterium]
MRCLVTGASGFIGSWLVRKLISEGHYVRVLCRKTSTFPLIYDLDFDKAFGDITDLKSLPAAFENIDVVFHLAGHIGYRKSERAMMEKINVLGTENMLAVAKATPSIKRFVHLSSVVAVGAGRTPFEILDENSPYLISSYNFGYFETKRKAEKLVLAEAQAGNLDAFALNPSTVYGPGDMLKGSRKSQLKVMRGKLPFYPHGGVNVVGVFEVVDTIYKSVELAKTGERYILCGDENLYIKDLLEKIAALAGSKPPKIELPSSIMNLMGFIGKFTGGKPIDSETAKVTQLYHWFRCTKAKKELEFKPSPVDEALQSSVKWAKDNIL